MWAQEGVCVCVDLIQLKVKTVAEKKPDVCCFLLYVERICVCVF